MPLVNKGTDPASIAARLNEHYANLTSPRLKDVISKRKSLTKTFVPSRTASEDEQQEYLQFESGLLTISNVDQEYGSQIQAEEQPKLKYDLPKDYKSTKLCICLRPHASYECDRCHHYIYGRISEICEKHPEEFFLMDFRSCPYCKAPIEMIMKSPISWETIRKIEEEDLPNDGDL